MSRAASRIFGVGVVCSLVVATACVCAGVWAVVGFPVSALEGLPVGNKMLVAYRFVGCDVRVATMPPVEVFLGPTTGPTENTIALDKSNRAWGGIDHWLKVPAVDVSLWWPFACSLVLPTIALVRRLRRRRRGIAGFELVGRDPGS
jgi:hypothetical protein